MKTKLKITALLFVSFMISLMDVHTSYAQTNENKNDAVTLTEENKNKLTGYLEMNYYRHYLWRGALWGNDDVSQPEIHVDYGKFSFALCSNLNLYPKNLPDEFYKKKVVFDEQDIELGHQNKLGKMEYQVLLWGYFYFNQLNTPNTGELFVKLQYPVFKNTKVFTENIADIASYKGAYFNSTGIVYEKEINKLAIEYKIFSGLGNAKFNEAYYGTRKTLLNYVGSSLNLEYSLKHNFYVAAKAEYNQYTSKEIRLVTGLHKTDNWSVYFGWEF